VIVAPLPIVRGSGSPCRVLALVEPEVDAHTTPEDRK
jgi:hypothetical protein